MSKQFRTKNNDNFYYIKELQWTNKAAKMNSFYHNKKPQIMTKKLDPASIKKRNYGIIDLSTQKYQCMILLKIKMS